MSQICESRLSIFQIRNEQSKICQRLVNFCQSGEISPNLVTLLVPPTHTRISLTRTNEQTNTQTHALWFSLNWAANSHSHSMPHVKQEVLVGPFLNCAALSYARTRRSKIFKINFFYLIQKSVLAPILSEEDAGSLFFLLEIKSSSEIN